ncbi:MAG TPA: transposase, partial [Chloroflexota bacterium]|nr:transposase [Chloroflexota bacterium]
MIRVGHSGYSGSDPIRLFRLPLDKTVFVSRDLGTELHRILGTDLTQVSGLQTSTIHNFFAEVGCDLSKFPTSKHFCSWLGLCPDNRISGG